MRIRLFMTAFLNNSIKLLNFSILKLFIANNKLMILLLAVFSLTLFSCSDQIDEGGINIVTNGNELIVKHDSTQKLEAYTYRYKNNIFPGGKIGLSYSYFGEMFDSKIGTRKNSTMLVFKSTVNSPSFDSLTVINSVTLNIVVLPSFGDVTDQKIEFNCYNLILEENQNALDLLDNTKFDINTTLKNYVDYSKPLFESAQVITPDKNSDTLEFVLPVSIFTDSIKKSKNFDSTLFNAKVFRGIYIEAKKTTPFGHLARFNALSLNTSIYIHYTKYTSINDKVGTVDSLRLAVSDYYNFYENDFSQIDISATADSALSYGTEIPSQLKTEEIYIMGNYGFGSRIRIENIQNNWNDGKLRVINRAILQIHPEDTTDFLNFGPENLRATLVVNDSAFNALAAHVYNGTSYTEYKGWYDVNLTTEFQNAIAKGENFIEIDLQVPSNQMYPHRVLLQSPTNSNPLKLIVSYTELNP